MYKLTKMFDKVGTFQPGEKIVAFEFKTDGSLFAIETDLSVYAVEKV